MKVEIRIWSAIGSTPITNRIGSFCDELVFVTVDAADLNDAKAQGKVLLASTPYAERGHISAPEWWNQNQRSTWLSK